jgi:hypothetical protein
MKQLHLKQLLYIFFLTSYLGCYAQNFHLKIKGTNNNEDQIIDSLNYSPNHPNLKSLYDEINNTSDKLSKKGYLDNKILETNKVNDSSYLSIISLKTRTKKIHIYIGRNNLFLIHLKQITTP